MQLSDIVAYVAIGAGIAGILTFLIGALPAHKLAKLQAVIQYFQQKGTQKNLVNADIEYMRRTREILIRPMPHTFVRSFIFGD